MKQTTKNSFDTVIVLMLLLSCFNMTCPGQGTTIPQYIVMPAATANSQLQWHTFLGGKKDDFGNDIAIDANGNIYIAGTSKFTWGNPLRPYGGGEDDAFIAKLNANGTLKWNTFLGGSNYDNAAGIGMDNNGNIYVLGSSFSTWGNPLEPCDEGYPNTFLAKLTAKGILQWNSFFPLKWWSRDCGITVDESGNIYISGTYDLDGLGMASVTKYNTNGGFKWVWYSNDPGSDCEIIGQDVAIDKNGNVYCTGFSSITWGDPLRPFCGGIGDMFVAKLNANGKLQWNTFLGGSGYDEGTGIVVDKNGNINIVGSSDFTWGSPLKPFSGHSDAYVAMLNTKGDLQWNTFLGGSGHDEGTGIALDGSGNIFVVGTSGADWGNPLDPHNGGDDAFIAKLNCGFTVKLDLQAERREARAFSILRQYGQIQFGVETSNNTVTKYNIMRRQGSGDFVTLRTVSPSELQNNVFQMQDKYLEKDITYTYRVEAYNAAEQLIGISLEKTI